MKRLAAAFAVLLVLLALVALPAATASAAVPATPVTFEPLVATARLGEPVTISTILQSPTRPVAVELLTRAPRVRGTSVQVAELTEEGGGRYRATIELDAHVTPNTSFMAQFRAQLATGETVLGAETPVTVVDDRFEWRTLEGPLIRLHWYEGDEAFAQRALEIGQAAVDRASDLLGVEETEPVDFFIYAAEEPFREALGPGTRENVGGQANAAIRTLFGLIEPNEIESDWVDVLVTHELTHLVFATATDNPYHEPPRWLNEGLAIYLSEGYLVRDSSTVQGAGAGGDLMPIIALGDLFPTTRARFNLAYAESVSAVDFFIRTHDQEQLVELIRSYAAGVTDDEAFTAATGEDLDAFNTAWLESLGAQQPEPFGPQPAPPGPVPQDWAGFVPQPTGAAQPTDGSGGVVPSAGPGNLDTPPSDAATSTEPLAAIANASGPVALGLAVVFLVAVLVLGLLGVTRSNRSARRP